MQNFNSNHFLQLIETVPIVVEPVPQSKSLKQKARESLLGLIALEQVEELLVAIQKKPGLFFITSEDESEIVDDNIDEKQSNCPLAYALSTLHPKTLFQMGMDFAVCATRAEQFDSLNALGQMCVNLSFKNFDSRKEYRVCSFFKGLFFNNSLFPTVEQRTISLWSGYCGQDYSFQSTFGSTSLVGFQMLMYCIYNQDQKAGTDVTVMQALNTAIQNLLAYPARNACAHYKIVEYQVKERNIHNVCMPTLEMIEFLNVPFVNEMLEKHFANQQPEAHFWLRAWTLALGSSVHGELLIAMKFLIKNLPEILLNSALLQINESIKKIEEEGEQAGKSQVHLSLIAIKDAIESAL